MGDAGTEYRKMLREILGYKDAKIQRLGDG
jgi:hypothetical protein